MANEEMPGVPSTAAIRGHPIHPMIIPFPIAFLTGALATDLAYLWTADPFWARASLWLVGAGLATGVLAAVAGLVEFVTIGRAREHRAGWIHFLGNAFALALALSSLLLRLGDPVAAALPWGLALSVVIAATLAVTGWFGGELSFRHKIGVTGHEESRSQQERGRRRDRPAA